MGAFCSCTTATGASSNPRGSSTPYQQQNQVSSHIDPTASTQPINSSQPQLQPRPSTNASSHSNNRHHHNYHHGRSSDLSNVTNRPNRPLKVHVWASEDRTWTRAALDKARKEWIDTRVTQENLVWQVLYQACEEIWKGELQTAQQLLDAMEITVPSGDMTRGCYDKKGAEYRVPNYVASDPTNLAEPDSEDKSEDESGTEAAELRREAKGKGIEDPADIMTIVAKRVDLGEHKLKIDINKNDSCRMIIRKMEEQATLAPNQRIRIFYGGKELKDGQNLEAHGFKLGDVILSMVFTDHKQESDAELVG